MEKAEKENLVATLEGLAIVEVDGDTLKLTRRMSRTQVVDLGTILITENGLDLAGLQDNQIAWHLHHLADMGNEPVAILRS